VIDHIDYLKLRHDGVSGEYRGEVEANESKLVEPEPSLLSDDGDDGLTCSQSLLGLL
jgi:hypothetical protein